MNKNNELKVVSVETESFLIVKFGKIKEYHRYKSGAWFDGWDNEGVEQDKNEQLEAAYQRFLGVK